jgi:hypothetical protein
VTKIGPTPTPLTIGCDGAAYRAGRNSIGVARTRAAIVLTLLAVALMASCDGTDHQTSPPPHADLRVMAGVEQYTESGEPLADVSVVVSLNGEPVTGAEVTLNGHAIPPAASGRWYRGSSMPFADGPDVVVQVNSSLGNRTLEGTLPGKVTLRRPANGESIQDDAPIPVAWDPIFWDSVATPHEITLEYTQGSPFYLATLPSDATAHDVPSSATSQTPMEFLIVTAWGGHADPGSPEQDDWLGQDGLRLGSRAVAWVEITP